MTAVVEHAPIHGKIRTLSLSFRMWN